jgi:multiple sugar transport system substrate-binding protein
VLNVRNIKIIIVCGILVLLSCVFVAPQVIAADQTTLTFWTFLSSADVATNPRAKVQTILIEEFEKINQNVKIEAQIVPWAELSPRLIQAVAAGKGPDVIIIACDQWESQIAADTLIPLDQFIDEEYKTDWLLPWSRGGINKDGKKIAIWKDNSLGVLYYRKDYLQEVGASAPPKTWDELGRIAGELCKKGYVGFTVGLSQGGMGNGFNEWFKAAIWSAGGDTLDEDGKAAFNGPAGQKVMQLMLDLVSKYKAIPKETLEWDGDAMFQGFQAGRVAMLISATKRVVAVRQTGIGSNLQVAPFPSFNADEPGPVSIGGWGYAITKDSKNADIAWKFIDYITSTEAEITAAKISGEIPPRKSAYNDPWFQEDAAGQEMMEWKNFIINNGRVAKYPAELLYLNYVLVEAAQKIVQAGAPIKSTLDEAAEKYNSKLSK